MHANKRRLLTPAEMGQVDSAAAATGQPGIALMEAAGGAVARAIDARWTVRPVAVLCGPGNNGGDGFVAARHLVAMGWPVKLGLLGTTDQLSADAAHHAALWQGQIQHLSIATLDGADLVVDALFGAGLSRPLAGTARLVIDALIQWGGPVCAIDVPSGLDGASGQIHGAAASVQLTVTFFRKKPGHVLLPGRQLCGDLLLADIGIPAAVLDSDALNSAAATWENSPELWLERYPWPQADDYKYRRGHVLVSGGAIMTGAARLAAVAAARVGAGLVTVAVPASAWAVYASALTSVMVAPLSDQQDLAVLLDDARINTIVIGPGAGVSEDTRQKALTALATRRKVVLDADAISSFSDDPTGLFQAVVGPCVLTPHEGEFARLFSRQGDKLADARDAARASGCVIVLKGSDTVIAAPDGRAVINSNAPPELATGGTGDVLSGLIAGLMAQGMEPFLAAAAAVWLHGEAAHEGGCGLIAEDLAGFLRPVLRRLKEQTWPPT